MNLQMKHNKMEEQFLKRRKKRQPAGEAELT